jgi:hypothetical protein
LFESGVDFFEGFVTEVGDTQQGLRAGLEQLANREDPFFFQAVGGSDLETDFRGAKVEVRLELTSFFVGLADGNTRHINYLRVRSKTVEIRNDKVTTGASEEPFGEASLAESRSSSKQKAGGLSKFPEELEIRIC